MRILLWHGWLLAGSGSNVVTARVAEAYRRQGHEVLLLCQEGHPERHPFVDAWGTVGVSENVIEASWLALADSFEYKLFKDAEGNPPESYQIEYQLRSLRQVDNEMKIVQSHLVEIMLPGSYPRLPPQCRILVF